MAVPRAAPQGARGGGLKGGVEAAAVGGTGGWRAVSRVGLAVVERLEGDGGGQKRFLGGD